MWPIVQQQLKIPVSRIAVRPLSPVSLPLTVTASVLASQKPCLFTLGTVVKVLESNLVASSPLKKKKKVGLNSMITIETSIPKGDLPVILVVGQTRNLVRDNSISDQASLSKRFNGRQGFLLRESLQCLSKPDFAISN